MIRLRRYPFFRHSFVFLTLFFSSLLATGAPLEDGSVIYGVVPTLFGSRPFQDVAAKIDEIKELGADAIWLAPINSTDDSSAISYSITDFFNIRPDFGTKEEFKNLITAAHARGIKVLMDFVPNHTSQKHAHYLDAEANGIKSQYYEYYDRDEHGNATHYFDWEHLPNLNFKNAGVRTMIENAFHHWASQFEVDGYRVDVAWGIRERAPRVWPKLIQNLRKEKPDLFFLAEAGAHDPYYKASGFNAAYDWTQNLGEWSWRDAFDHSDDTATRLAAALRFHHGHESEVARFLNNNDTGSRFVARYGVSKTRLAAVLQLTLPGYPIVYTGDEIGAEFDPNNDPAPLDWKDSKKLRPHYKKLIALRKQNPALRTGTLNLFPTGNAQVIGYLRRLNHAQEIAVVINFDSFKKTVRLPSLFLSASSTVLRDLLTGRVVSFKRQDTTRQIEISMSPLSAMILVVDGA